CPETLPPFSWQPEWEGCLFTPGQKKSPEGMYSGLCVNDKLAATYSPGYYPSTIGAEGLNFSVRNGKRWNTLAITTISFFIDGFALLLPFQSTSLFAMGRSAGWQTRYNHLYFLVVE